MHLRLPLLGVIGLCLVIVAFQATETMAQTASSLPMWFDVSSSTPPNLKLNTDATTQLQNEEQVAVDPTNPNNLVAVWRDFRLGFRQVGWGYSHDGGTSWTEGGLVPATPYNRDSDPAIVCNSDGVFYSVILSFQEGGAEDGMYVPVSFDSGQSWTFFLTGVENFNNLFEDKEMIAVDNTGGPSDGTLYISWARFGATTDVYCVRSLDGIGFDSERLVSDQSSVQWPVPAVGAGGRVVIAWWSYAMGAIMCDISTDQGWTWGTDRVVQDLTFFPQEINGGILTFGFPALMADVSGGAFDGRFYCAFVDYAADGFLDLYMTRSTDGGETWSPRQRLNDDPLGNNIDQFKPWVSVNPDGVVSVAFYDRRLDPNNLDFDMFVTHSFDGGDTWTPNQRVSEVSSSPFNAAKTNSVGPLTPFDPGQPIAMSPNAGLIGEYIGIASSRLRATIAFTDTRNGHQDVYAANMPLRLFPPRPIPLPDPWINPQRDTVWFTWTNWSPYDHAPNTHILEFSIDSLFLAGVTRIDGIPQNMWNGASDMELLPDGRHFWRARIVDQFGDSSGWSPVRSVWVDTTRPETPTPIYPTQGNGGEIIDQTPTFVWTHSSEGSGTPVSYGLSLASDTGFTTGFRFYPGIADTHFTLPEADSLFVDQTWFWRVIAGDQAGNNSSHTPGQKFTVIPPFVLGDYNGDEILDVVDVVGMINLAFRGETLPLPPPERMDINCDTFYDIVDVVLLINHVFRGGPAPSC